MILSKLKESTKEQHEALEFVVDVMRPDLTMDHYKGLLAKFYLFYAAIEPALPADLLRNNGFDLDKRLKLPALEKDMNALGISDPEVEAGIGKPEVPVLNTTAKGFGAAYVLEGATLGGQIISRHLRSTLSIDADSGAAFFSSYGPNVGPMWKEFGATITNFAEDGSMDDEIVESAKTTFDAFKRYLERPQVKWNIISAT